MGPVKNASIKSRFSVKSKLYLTRFSTYNLNMGKSQSICWPIFGLTESPLFFRNEKSNKTLLIKQERWYPGTRWHNHIRCGRKMHMNIPKSFYPSPDRFTIMEHLLNKLLTFIFRLRSSSNPTHWSSLYANGTCCSLSHTRVVLSFFRKSQTWKKKMKCSLDGIGEVLLPFYLTNTG